MMNVHIDDAPEVRRRYQELLLSDWSASTLPALMELLYIEIAPLHESELGGVLDPRHRRNEPVNAFVLDRIRSLASVFGLPALPKVPKHAANVDISTRRAEAAWTRLVFQAFASIKGDAGFFADLQSALYICCSDYLVPLLKKKGHPAHQDILLNAMYLHTLLVWKQRPDHMYHLQAILLGCLGRTEERIELLERSLRLTPDSDHSHLTKVQMYWSDLVDVGQFDEAVQLLLDEYRRAPKSDEKEIRSMLLQTQRMMPRQLARK